MFFDGQFVLKMLNQCSYIAIFSVVCWYMRPTDILSVNCLDSSWIYLYLEWITFPVLCQLFFYNNYVLLVKHLFFLCVIFCRNHQELCCLVSMRFSRSWFTLLLKNKKYTFWMFENATTGFLDSGKTINAIEIASNSS